MKRDITGYIRVIGAVLLASLIDIEFGRFIGIRALYFIVIIYFSLFTGLKYGLFAAVSSSIAFYFTLLIPRVRVSNMVETVGFLLESIVFIAISWQSQRSKKAKEEMLRKAERIQKSVDWLYEINNN